MLDLTLMSDSNPAMEAEAIYSCGNQAKKGRQPTTHILALVAAAQIFSSIGLLESGKMIPAYIVPKWMCKLLMYAHFHFSARLFIQFETLFLNWVMGQLAGNP